MVIHPDMARMAARAKRAAAGAANLVWPARSIISGVPAQGALTAEDWTALTFLTDPLCYRCGTPQAVDLGQGAICATCTARSPRWGRARAALAYDAVSRVPILAMKRAGRRDGLYVMASWMHLAGSALLNEADMILPVPLHPLRLAQRGFNQAGWLAEAVGKRARVPVRHGVLKRQRRTPSQGTLTARQRRQNVTGAFSVHSRRAQMVRARRILLVDDVLTTGATVEACTRALLAAGAQNVDILVLARVVRETDVTI